MLKAIFGADVFGDAPTPAEKPASPTEPARAAHPGIDIKRAIDSHVHWRRHLEDSIRGTGGERLCAETLAASDRCELGRWLHGEGQRRYGHHDVFAELQQAHAKLHERSAAIARTALAGAREEAIDHLKTSEFARSTTRVKNLLAKVYVEVLSQDGAQTGR